MADTRHCGMHQHGVGTCYEMTRCASMMACSCTCVSFSQVVTHCFCVNATAAKLQHVAALQVAAILTGSVSDQLKLLLQSFLQQIAVVTACSKAVGDCMPALPSVTVTAVQP